MRINYRFFKNLPELRKIGFDIPKDDIAFVIYEDDEKFEKVKEILGENWLDSVIITDTDFTEKEITSSLYLSVFANKMLGYPQPESWYDESEDEEIPEVYPYESCRYLHNVFEITPSETYGYIRGKQIGYLSIQGEPKWGKSSIGGLFWLEDILFTTPEVYKTVFEPLGIECKTVLGYGNQKPLTTVVQLVPQGVSNSKLLLKDEDIEEKVYISEWHLERYCLNGKGFYPSFESNPGSLDFFVSRELFGAGGANFRENFISQRLYRLLKQNNVKGLGYSPQESASPEEMKKYWSDIESLGSARGRWILD